MFVSRQRLTRFIRTIFASLSCNSPSSCLLLMATTAGGPLDIPELKGKKIVVPLCGGNIDVATTGRVIDRGLAADSRLVRFIVPVSDRPGGISTLTKVISDSGGSIRDIYHERAWLHTHMDQVQVCVLSDMSRTHPSAGALTTQLTQLTPCAMCLHTAAAADQMCCGSNWQGAPAAVARCSGSIWA